MKTALVLFWSIIAALGVAAAGGWVANIVKLFGLFGEGPTAELFVRLIGVPVAFIGMVAGYL